VLPGQREEQRVQESLLTQADPRRQPDPRLPETAARVERQQKLEDNARPLVDEHDRQAGTVRFHPAWVELCKD
jgi:hypothetical protein